MALPLISETFQRDRGQQDPAHKPVFDLTPPLDLTQSLNFVVGQPFVAFRDMRENAPVMWHPCEKMEGFWALTRYDDIKRVDQDAATFSSQQGGILAGYLEDVPNHPYLFRSALDNMICLDAPHHLELRREHMQYFRPGYIAELKQKVEAEIARLLEEMAQNGPELDLVPALSSRIPLFTLCEMLGIPEADRPKIIEWMEMLELAQNTVEQADLGNVDPAQIMAFMTEVQALFDYGREILLERRKQPRNDLLSAIANVEIDGALLPDEYLDGSWLLIVFAGNDTTRNSISGTMKLLTQFPSVTKALKNNPDLFPNFVNEAIRMVSPVMYMRRTATRDTEIRGQKIAAGEKIIMWFGAANRDPEMFENPDIFDIHRSNAKNHIAFGHGPHVCLGQRVANMQLEAVFRQVLSRFPDIKWTGEEQIAPNSFTHSITSLMVKLAP